LHRLKEVLDGAAAAGAPAGRLRLDLSIARGLDYYTGTVFETFLDALPGIGSVCSGGRYDNLAELFTSQELPGVGASLGLDRLLAAMEELGMIEKVSTPAPVFIPFFDKRRLHDYLRLASALRAAGIGVEVFCDPKRLGDQLKYADRRGFRIALIVGGDEFQAGVCQVKNLQTGEKQDVPLAADAASVIAAVKKVLGGAWAVGSE
jgi:histidyl-tRNA synthetase